MAERTVQFQAFLDLARDSVAQMAAPDGPAALATAALGGLVSLARRSRDACASSLIQRTQPLDVGTRALDRHGIDFNQHLGLGQACNPAPQAR